MIQAVVIEHLAAGARHQGTWGFCDGNRSPAFPHRIFARGPILRVAPSLKIGLGPIGESADAVVNMVALVLVALEEIGEPVELR
jgi:hypothetical protein